MVNSQIAVRVGPPFEVLSRGVFARFHQGHLHFFVHIKINGPDAKGVDIKGPMPIIAVQMLRVLHGK